MPIIRIFRVMKDIPRLKKELRHSVMQQPLDGGYIREAGERIARRVLSMKEYIDAECLFVYVSTENEPSTEAIISDALSHNKTVCVPKCYDGGMMRAVKIESTDVLQKGRFSIPEPTEGEPIDPSLIDIAIIPCLAASSDCRRIGHGLGYYDRFLEKCPHAFKMCLCFNQRILPDIPTDEHDIPMDAVVTEREVFTYTQINII